MSAIEDGIAAIDGVLDQVAEVVTAASAVRQEAEQALDAAVALGYP